jgi:hypothetical protein
LAAAWWDGENIFQFRVAGLGSLARNRKIDQSSSWWPLDW